MTFKIQVLHTAGITVAFIFFGCELVEFFFFQIIGQLQ